MLSCTLRYGGVSQVELIRKKKLKCAIEWRGMSVVFTRVVCRTFASRGKSFTPESRIDILEARNWVLERREETQDDRGLDIIGLLLKILHRILCMKTENCL